MRILGIDPGYDRLGIAIIQKPLKGREGLIYSECFKTSPKDPVYSRLASIGKEILRVLDEFKPDELAIENLFITKNQKTAMRVAEARGIILYETQNRGIPIKEYTPMEIKLAVTGDGGSDKLRMIKMVKLLIKIPDKKAAEDMLDDEYDAIAAALAHSAMRR